MAIIDLSFGQWLKDQREIFPQLAHDHGASDRKNARRVNELRMAYAAGKTSGAKKATQPPAVGVDVSEEVREWIGYLVSMAAITDEEMARHYAEKIDAALRTGGGE